MEPPVNSSKLPSPSPEQTSDSAPLPPGSPKATHSQSDLITSGPESAAVPSASVAVDVGAVLSGYKIVQKLGEGGMGAVFIAEDVALRRKVALKTMKPEMAAKESSRQRFFREARAAARIEHDNIVPIFQVGEDNGVPFLAMALLKGESLGDYLKKHPRPTVPFILKIGRDMATGLAAAHKEGLIHHDIKPDNIWIEPLPEGGGVRAKILDFGLARPQDEEQSLVTQEGAILGTPAYMAPEQARGGNVDARADLFSLGVVLYQMTTGRRPFTGPNTMAVLSSLALDIPPEPATINVELPPTLSRLIVRLLEKDPARRIQSAGEAVDVFKRLQPEATVVVVATSQPKQEASPWADIDADSMTNVEPPPPMKAESVRNAERGMRNAESKPKTVAKAAGGSKRGLLIGVAAAVVLLAGVGIFLATRSSGDKKDKSQDVAKNDGKDKGPPAKVEPKKKGEVGKPIPPPTAGQFIPLFNGVDLTGWATGTGGVGNWKVVDGAITCSGKASHLFTARDDFDDFHLRVEAKINDVGNSGVYCRALKNVGFPTGYEAQIALAKSGQAYRTGSLYNLVKVAEDFVSPDTWFTMEVIAVGPRIRILLDGKEMVNHVDAKSAHTKGHIALQHHDALTKVSFRKVEIKPLKGDGPPMAAARSRLAQGGRGEPRCQAHRSRCPPSPRVPGARQEGRC